MDTHTYQAKTTEHINDTNVAPQSNNLESARDLSHQLWQAKRTESNEVQKRNQDSAGDSPLVLNSIFDSSVKQDSTVRFQKDTSTDQFALTEKPRLKDHRSSKTGSDGLPIFDERYKSAENPDGLWRLDEQGQPVGENRYAPDPRTLLEMAQHNERVRSLDPITQSLYKAAIESADATDKDSLARKAIGSTEELLNPDNAQALQWDLNLSNTIAEQSNLTTELGQLRESLSADQLQSLSKLWSRQDGSIEEFLNNPANQNDRRNIESYLDWPKLKERLEEIDRLGRNIAEGMKYLMDNPSFAASVNKVREARATHNDTKSLILSPIETRSAYLQALLRDENVKAFENLPKEEKLKHPLRHNTNVKEVGRIREEIERLKTRLDK